MPDSLLRSPLSSTPLVTLQRADGWLVVLHAGEQIDHYYTDEWSEAYDWYSEPPTGWTAVAICACQDGIPVARLTYADVCELLS